MITHYSAESLNAMTKKSNAFIDRLIARIISSPLDLNGYRLTGICLIILGLAAAFDNNGRIPQWIHEQFPLLSQSVLAAFLCIPGGVLVARDYRLVDDIKPLRETIPLYIVYLLVLIYIQQGVSSPPSLFGYAIILTSAINAVFVGLHSAYVSDLRKRYHATLIELEKHKQVEGNGQ